MKWTSSSVTRKIARPSPTGMPSTKQLRNVFREALLSPQGSVILKPGAVGSLAMVEGTFMWSCSSRSILISHPASGFQRVLGFDRLLMSSRYKATSALRSTGRRVRSSRTAYSLHLWPHACSRTTLLSINYALSSLGWRTTLPRERTSLARICQACGSLFGRASNS